VRIVFLILGALFVFGVIATRLNPNHVNLAPPLPTRTATMTPAPKPKPCLGIDLDQDYATMALYVSAMRQGISYGLAAVTAADSLSCATCGKPTAADTHHILESVKIANEFINEGASPAEVSNMVRQECSAYYATKVAAPP
jgi:hypothetical protein